MCLVARYLDERGIPTVCLGSAHDILTAGRPPRAVFVDYPLGHTAGIPFDADDQLSVIRGAVASFDGATTPGSFVTLPNQWRDDDWKSEASSTEAEDTRQPRDTTPQFQLPADRDAAIESGALTSA